MAPNTMLLFKKKLVTHFQENFQTEGWKEGQTDPNSWDPFDRDWGSKKIFIKSIFDLMVDFSLHTQTMVCPK